MMKRFIFTLISIALIVPVGFYAKFYRGPAAFWVNNSLSGVFYEIFWCLVVFLLFPRAKVLKIALGVFIVTCLLETLQLWHPPFLEAIRNTFLGRSLIGTHFVVSDFVYYVIGSGIGWFWIAGLGKYFKE